MINELYFLVQVFILSGATIFLANMGPQALTAYVSLLFVMANVFVIKQIELFGYTVTSADAFIIGISLSLNILQEFWGKQYARSTVWISFALSTLYLIIAKAIVAYNPAPIDSAHIHLAYITTYTTRLVLASFAAYLITQMIDIYLYGKFKSWTHGKYFVARNYASLIISQLIDTILFSFFGLYGVVTHMTDIIIVSYLVKLSAIVCISPFLIVAKKFIKKH